jgi:uncharacterized protein (DUF4415 family)
MKADDDLPEITDEMLARAELRIGERVIRRGRPPLESPKQAIKLRLDAEVVEHFRETGPGWQTRINEALRRVLNVGPSLHVPVSPRSPRARESSRSSAPRKAARDKRGL